MKRHRTFTASLANWISLEPNGNVGPLSSKDDIKMWIVDMGGFYQIHMWGQEKPVTLDALLGVRYWNVSDELTLSGPGICGRDNS